MRDVVLASTSPYRRQLLDRLGIAYQAVAPPFEETLDPSIAPPDVVLRNAEGKARSVAADHPDAIIIGSDQLGALDFHILAKPGDPRRAMDQLSRMAGREHLLHTAVAILDARDGRLETHVEITVIELRDLTDEEIRRYVERENPIDCAGSYKVEGLGISLIAHQRGDDPTAVQGMPLIATCRILRGFGVPIP